MAWWIGRGVLRPSARAPARGCLARLPAAARERGGSALQRSKCAWLTPSSASALLKGAQADFKQCDTNLVRRDSSSKFGIMIQVGQPESGLI